MKHLKNKKIIIILLIVITLFNFILPTVSQAVSKPIKEIANGLYCAVCKFLCHVGDLFVVGMQEAFIGDADIPDEDEYEIKYSPGVIFSGKVPALDINFFNPETFYKDKTEIRYEGRESGKFIKDSINFEFEGVKKLNSSDDAVVQTRGIAGIKEKLESNGYVLENFEYGYEIGEKTEFEIEDPNYKGYRITVWI